MPYKPFKIEDFATFIVVGNGKMRETQLFVEGKEVLLKDLSVHLPQKGLTEITLTALNVEWHSEGLPAPPAKTPYELGYCDPAEAWT